MTLGNIVDGTWCVAGDFNEVLFISDRSIRRNPNQHMVNFKDGSSILV